MPIYQRLQFLHRRLRQLSFYRQRARVFENKIDCKNPTHKLGHILFLQPSPGVDMAGYYDLFIMSGDGCFPNLVMKQVSGSPAWSKDGDRIAVGCENNEFICVLDSKTILENCADLQDDRKADCSPLILSKYALPPSYSLYNRLYRKLNRDANSRRKTQNSSFESAKISVFQRPKTDSWLITENV